MLIAGSAISTASCKPVPRDDQSESKADTEVDEPKEKARIDIKPLIWLAVGIAVIGAIAFLCGVLHRKYKQQGVSERPHLVVERNHRGEQAAKHLDHNSKQDGHAPQEDGVIFVPAQKS